MFRIVKIIALSFVVLVLIGAFWLNQHNVSAARGGVKGPVEYDFPQGGNVTLDLSAGDYEIHGTPDNKIRVRYSYSDYVRDTASIVAKTEGNNANITIEGPNSGFHVVIDLPEKTNLTSDLSAGKFSLRGIEGNKNINASAGKVEILLADPSGYKDVEATVISGNLEARPWHARRGGLFRHFEKHGGSGPYDLQAHVTAGNLVIDSASLSTGREMPPPYPPAPPHASGRAD